MNYSGYIRRNKAIRTTIRRYDQITEVLNEIRQIKEIDNSVLTMEIQR